MHKLGFIFVILISLLAIRPLFIAGYFPMHDDTQPSRIYEMSKELKSFQFPVRWVSDLGYGLGYPIFNFYAPLPYYIGAIPHLINFSAVDSAKIMMGFGMLLASVSMYLLGRHIGGILVGFLTALLYQFTPYHAVDLYVRGAVGEIYAYAFIPVIILGVILIFEKKYKQGFIVTTLGLTLTFLSHNILGLIVLYYFVLLIGIIFVSQFVIRSHKKVLMIVCISFVFSLVLSSFFLLPAFFEKDFTKVSTLVTGGSNYIQHFVYPSQLWDSTWGYGGSAPGLEDGMSFKLGKLHIILFIITAFIYFWQDKKDRKILYFGLLYLFISVIFTLDASSFLWEVFPGFSFIQYPWRFIALVLLFLVFCIGIGISYFERFIKISLSIFSIIILLVMNLKYFEPRYIYSTNDEKYISKEALNWDISKISDEYMPNNFQSPQSVEEMEILKKNQSISDLPGQKRGSSVRTLSNIISLLGLGMFILIISSKKINYFNS